MPAVPLNGTSLYYEEHGGGEPLLLIAGLGSDSSTWAGVVPAFAARFRTVVFDHRGTGRSGAPAPAWTVGQMARDVIGLMDHLKIERAHLVGHSMGGYVAQELALAHPGRVGGLVLESTAPVSSERNNGLFTDFYHQLKREGYSKAWFERWAPWLFSPARAADDPFVKAFVRRSLSYPYPPSADGFKSQIDAIAAFDARERIGAVKTKTLILEGKDDKLIPPEEAAALAEKINGSVFRLLDGAGHALHLEDPQGVTGAVLEFLTGRA